MGWVLIILMTGSSKAAVTSIPFETKALCEAARKVIEKKQGWETLLETTCVKVRKGAK